MEKEDEKEDEEEDKKENESEHKNENENEKEKGSWTFYLPSRAPPCRRACGVCALLCVHVMFKALCTELCPGQSFV